MLRAFACLLMLAAVLVARPLAGEAGSLIVLNKSGHDAHFIDLESGETWLTLPTGQSPHEVLFCHI